MENIYITNSPEETEAVGALLAKMLTEKAPNGALIAMEGEMGVGKTALVRGFCNAIGIRGAKSPTYTIVNEYRGGGRVLCHLDLYRIEGEDDLYSVGFYDYEGVMMAAEWCEKAPFALPDAYLRITIEKTGDESRRITAEEVPSAL
jgi:tRNA threonylcarbamoyladenosine biosynthesis protein TsaE